MLKLLLTIYNILFILLLVPASVLLLVFSSKYRKEIFYKLSERFALCFAFSSGKFAKDSSKKTVWVHCASLGEVRAVEPVINGLKDEYNVVLTVLTKTGREYAQKIEKLCFVSLLPLDIYPLMLKAFKTVKPDVFVIVETELWVSTLCAAKKCGIKIMTANGRMSEKSFNFYKRTKFFWQPFISLIDIVAARNASDAKRFAAFTGKETIISVSGNIKYDRDFKVDSKRSDYGLTDKDIVFTAGSIRNGEEKIIIQTYNELKQSFPDIKFFFAPRHLSRLNAIKKILSQNKIKFSLFSQIPLLQPQIQNLVVDQDSPPNPCHSGLDPESGAISYPHLNCDRGVSVGRGNLPRPIGQFPHPPDPHLILVDVFGKLQNIYAISDFSFVGGSLINKGGQNPIEPAACGKPVLFGKYMSNFEHEAETLLKSGGAFQVSDAKNLADKVTELISNKELSKTAGQNALKTVESQKGAVKITVTQIKRCVDA